jgi:hypothetical protein
MNQGVRGVAPYTPIASCRVSLKKGEEMHRSKSTFATRIAGAGVLSIGITAAPLTPACADSVVPPTPLRPATSQDIVSPDYPTDDFISFSAQNPKGVAKVLITWQTAARQVPCIAINVTKPDGSYANLFTLLTTPAVRTGLPSISATPADSSADRIDFRWVPVQGAYHLTFKAAGMSGDLWFRNNKAGAAMQPVQWDGQEVFWASSIGRADIDGTIQFPTDVQPTSVSGWQGEQERMGEPFSPAGHKGYEYAQTSNPDGSADQLFLFPQLIDGSWRGLYAHLDRSGKLTYCEPDIVQLGNYQKTAKGYAYPGAIYAKCSAQYLDITYTVTTPEDFPVVPAGITMPVDRYLAYTTISAGSSNTPGSVGTVQHLRDLGFYGS